LICPADPLAFPIRDGIPVMLDSEARVLEPASGDERRRARLANAEPLRVRPARSAVGGCAELFGAHPGPAGIVAVAGQALADIGGCRWWCGWRNARPPAARHKWWWPPTMRASCKLASATALPGVERAPITRAAERPHWRSL